MRTLVLFVSLVLWGGPPDPAFGAGAPSRLESVSILPAGSGTSLAVRSSEEASLVATTAADATTAVIELVGITAERRDMAVSDASGLISRIAIESTGVDKNTVTRIRVTLAQSYRHRLRIAGKLVYVDFERGTAPATLVASAPPIAPVQKTPPPAPTAARAAPTPPRTASRTTMTAAFHASPPPVRPAAVPMMDTGAVTAALNRIVSGPASLSVPHRSWMPLVLKDGSVVYSYGDYAQVGDQLMFLLPFEDADAPRTEAVSVPASAFDMAATRRAIESAKASRYATTSGPREYGTLTR